MKLLITCLVFFTFNVYGDIKYSIDDENIGNIIKAKINDQEVALTTRKEMKCYSLNKILDFNNDGYDDALITHQVACGGNGAPNEFLFITYNKESGFTKTEVFATSWEIPNIGILGDKIIVSLKPFILNKNLDQIKEKHFSLDSAGKVTSVIIGNEKILPIKTQQKKTEQTPKTSTPKPLEMTKQELVAIPPKNAEVIKAEKAESIERSASGSISLTLLVSLLGLLAWRAS